MTIKKVTTKSLKVLKELGLLDGNILSSYEIFLDEEKFKKLWDAVIVDPMPEHETVDLGEFTKAYTDFFGQLLPNLEK